jgi:hypothetical protein
MRNRGHQEDEELKQEMLEVERENLTRQLERVQKLTNEARSNYIEGRSERSYER